MKTSFQDAAALECQLLEAPGVRREPWEQLPGRCDTSIVDFRCSASQCFLFFPACLPAFWTCCCLGWQTKLSTNNPSLT